MQVVHYKSCSRKIAQMLGLNFSGALIFAVLVALRHMLDTPQQLDSCLPGESNLYMKNGRIALRGTCEACGTSLYRIGRAERGTPSV
jgi:uncharacterized protein DUF5679